jgi:hypothetical protein
MAMGAKRAFFFARRLYQRISARSSPVRMRRAVLTQAAAARATTMKKRASAMAARRETAPLGRGRSGRSRRSSEKSARSLMTSPAQ